MSGLRNVMKEGWHPKGRDGGKESWRGDFKGINQVAGWMGKGKDPNQQEAVEHVSRPLASLKDPSSFGPPPKNVNYHGGAALPNEITPHASGWGAPLTQAQIQRPSSAAEATTNTDANAQEQEQKPAGPPLPYRADRTGLKTDHLPPPPVHREVNRSPNPVLADIPKPRPNVPPRLPSRQNTAPNIVAAPPRTAATPPPSYDGIAAKQPSPEPSSGYGINQAAVNRLGKAGVSVPALGIGSGATTTSWQRDQSSQQQTARPNSTPTPPQPAINQISELQSRFARMNSNSKTGSNSTTLPPQSTDAISSLPSAHSPSGHPAQPEPTPPPAQSQATTWAEKQAALRTAQNLQRDPNSVTVGDARSAANTVGAFRERHQDSINAAGVKANEWNKKYNVTGRLNSFLEKHVSPTSETPPALSSNPPPQSQSPEMAASISRKPPPPPPPKKPDNMHGNVSSLQGAGGAVSPPPVPLGTKPSYS